MDNSEDSSENYLEGQGEFFSLRNSAWLCESLRNSKSYFAKIRKVYRCVPLKYQRKNRKTAQFMVNQNPQKILIPHG